MLDEPLLLVQAFEYLYKRPDLFMALYWLVDKLSSENVPEKHLVQRACTNEIVADVVSDGVPFYSTLPTQNIAIAHTSLTSLLVGHKYS